MDIIDNASALELHNIDTAIANRPKPTMTFTGRCHFSECRRAITRGFSVMPGVVMTMRLMSAERGWRHE
ncbi:hypothetical protein NFB70_07305 [Yersinia ruckeri]|uniref:hypothetical protein n=1 Tax=Yersinia ruckeri TaxID=29486 RepID=UPI00223905CA|nr:hypothetical protein [Yersinia ruckeri]MCW6600757.1 hypothetical protein [Yersinia ruckeri]